MLHINDDDDDDDDAMPMGALIFGGVHLATVLVAAFETAAYTTRKEHNNTFVHTVNSFIVHEKPRSLARCITHWQCISTNSDGVRVTKGTPRMPETPCGNDTVPSASIASMGPEHLRRYIAVRSLRVLVCDVLPNLARGADDHRRATRHETCMTAKKGC